MEQHSATRMHLLRLKQQEGVAQKGLTLLENKRQALVREFFSMVQSGGAARENLQKKMRKAQNALTLALGIMGRGHLDSVGFASRRELSVEIVEKNIWGVRFPDLHHQTAVRSLDARGYSVTGTTPHLDETTRKFEETLDLILDTVSIEMKLKRLGQEMRKVNRRINALKERILPLIRLRIKEIKIRLEEREHEDIFRNKRFKKKRGSF